MRRQPELRAGYRLNLGLLLLVVTLTLPRLFTFRPGVQAAEVFAFTLPNVLMFTTVIAVIDVILATALATLGAFIYNLSAGFVGGVELTLAEDE